MTKTPTSLSPRRWLGALAAITLVVALLAALPSGAGAAPSEHINPDNLEAVEPDSVIEASRDGWVKELGTGSVRQVYMVRLTNPAAPAYEGGIDGLAATAPARGAQFDVDTAAARDYVDHLTEVQDAVLADAESNFGRSLDVRHRYTYAANGFAAVMSADEARELAQDDRVAFIQADFERELHTDRGPQWINADQVWDAAAQLGLPADYQGEGMIVGVIDTGINPSNPSYADVGDDGYDHTNPFGAGNYVGVCDETNSEQFDPDFPCNDKLIGAWGFVTTGEALDDSGHGSHTSSTAAGNVVDDAELSYPSLPSENSFDISGVAPHANIISYMGCCSVAGLTDSIDQAIADGVDTINYSIGSPSPSSLWNDFDTVGFLNARAAGIFVATSNGNDGPGFATTGSPSDSPWIISVGASTHDRLNHNALVDLTGGDTTPPPDIVGKSVTAALGLTDLVYAGDVGDPLCEDTSGHEAEFTGNIVVCDRGEIGRVLKSGNVAAQGAAGFVLANDEANGDSLNGDGFAVPGVHISYDDGVVLKDWMASGSGHQAAINGTEFQIDDANGDIMAGFSSRGPNRAVDVVVPDVTAPGVDIMAAYGAGAPDDYDLTEFAMISGTSMASPHVAGAGTLLMQAHPEWTPAEVQSALMTTAFSDITDSDGTPASPYDQGAGRVDVAAAAQAHLVFDETFDDYLAANPDEGGDPKTLNLPSFANSQCLFECSWTRTAEVPADAATPDVTWTASVEGDENVDVTVEPASFTASPGDSQQFTVTADVEGAPVDEHLFSRITLTPDADVPSITMPMAVVPSAAVLPEAADHTTRRDAGSFDVENLRAGEITDFQGIVAGLVPADETAMTLGQDPTEGDPYDNIGDGTVEVELVDVPAGATRLRAALSDTTAPDLDLYVGFDTNGDGQASADEEVAFSASGGSLEVVDLTDPQAGQWWILVQNWDAGGDGPDDLLLSTAVVGDSVGNAQVIGPGSNPAGEPFDITVVYDEPAMDAGEDWFGTVVLGTSASTSRDIGTIPITIHRVEDDVTKEASVEEAEVGDTIGYDITVQSNVTTEELVYTITDTVPDGLEIDEASVTGGGTVVGQTITWEVTMPVPDPDFVEAECPGAYLDLAPLGINPNPALDGDTVAVGAFADLGPFSYYGDEYANLEVAEDGIVSVAGGYGGAPWIPQEIPSADLPNGLMAPLWSDLEATHSDPTTPTAGDESGVTLAQDSANGIALVEYDNLYEFTSGDEVGPAVGDFQVWVHSTVGDGPEVEVYYANEGVLPSAATIGVENFAGDQATATVNNADPAATFASGGVCYDFVGAGEPETLAYEVTVGDDAAGQVVTNEAEHVTDDPHAQPEVASDAVTIADAVPPEPVDRVAGANRIETAIALSQAGWDSADTVVIARADDYPDALAGSTLAAVEDAPILLNPRDELDSRVGDELARLGARKVYLLGGPAALGDIIGAQVTEVVRSQAPTADPDVGVVTRIAGENRAETAALIAEEVVELDSTVDDAIVSLGYDGGTGSGFADALSAGNLATTTTAPILLTRNDTLPDDTLGFLTDTGMLADGGDVYITGGPAAVSGDVETTLTGEGLAVTRLAGANRFETGATIVEEALAEGAGLEYAMVTTGLNWPDNLAASSAAFKLNGITTSAHPVTLDNSPATRDLLIAHADEIGTGVVIGGPAAVSDQVVQEVTDILD